MTTDADNLGSALVRSPEDIRSPAARGAANQDQATRTPSHWRAVGDAWTARGYPLGPGPWSTCTSQS